MTIRNIHTQATAKETKLTINASWVLPGSEGDDVTITVELAVVTGLVVLVGVDSYRNRI